MIKIKNRFDKLLEPNLPDSEQLRKQYKLEKVYKLDYNENRFGPTPKLNEGFNVKEVNNYPVFSSPELTTKLSRKYNLPNDFFYISNGSDAILDFIPELFTSITSDDNVILPELTYRRIEQTCVVKNIEMRKVPLTHDGFIDLEATLRVIDDKTSIIYIVNPNMPTGGFHSHETIVDFLNKVPAHILVVLDEAYYEFSVGLEESWFHDKKIIEDFDNVIITHTFSKLYGLASFRIGYSISRPYISRIFKKAAQYLPLSAHSAKAASICIDDDKYYSEIIRLLNKEKEKYYLEFSKLDIKFQKSGGNFIYVEWGNKEELSKIWEYLLANFGVIIRIVKDKGFRITIGTPEENDIVIKGFIEYLKNKKNS